MLASHPPIAISDARRSSAVRRMGQAISALCLLLGLPGCRQLDVKPSSFENVPPILLITVDTLRADYLGAYGGKTRTPYFDRVARDGVLFRNAYSQTPLTLPSHCSIMTGTNPVTHGVRDNIGFLLSQDNQTLPELLRDNGYNTGAFVGTLVLDSRFGLSQGFEQYDDDMTIPRSHKSEAQPLERKADQVAAAATQWIDKHATRPFFCWVHFYDPHTPYVPPVPYQQEYSQNPYAGEVAFTDAALGGLLRSLEERNIYNRTLIIITGDHGESLGEHGESTHGYFIYNSTLHVPLLIKLPDNKSAGLVLDDLAQSIDILPTVLAYVGINKPHEIQGIDLLHLIKQEHSSWSNLLYSETYYPRAFGWSELRSLRDKRYKYIAAPDPELFDLETDPKESINLCWSKGEIAAKMKQQLKELESRFVPSRVRQPLPVSNRTHEEQLRSLGYLASSARPGAPADSQPLADPKDKLPLYTLFSASQREQESGNTLRAAQLLQKIITQEPQMAVARQQLGSLYLSSGKYALAIQEYKKALSIQPDLLVGVFNLGVAHLRLRQFSEAVLSFKMATQLDGSDYEAWNYLGSAYVEAGRTQEAQQAFMRATKLKTNFAPAYLNLAVTYKKTGEWERAAELLRQSVRLDPVTTTYNELGSLLLEMGKTDEALEAYQKAVALSPDDSETLYNHGNVLAATGKLDLAIRAYQKSIQANPDFALAYNNLGNAYFMTNNLDRAEASYRKALDLDPKFAFASNNLGKIYLVQKRCALASRCFKRAINSDPRFAEAHFLLGTALQCLQDSKEAVRHFRIAERQGWRDKAMMVPSMPKKTH